MNTDLIAAFAVLTELAQIAMPHRTASSLDVLAAWSGLAAAWAGFACRKARVCRSRCPGEQRGAAGRLKLEV